MKQLRNTKGTLEALLVIGLILIIPLFFVMRTAAEQNTAQNTTVSIPPTAANAPAQPTTANAPAEDNAMKPQQPPACTFPLAEITTPESTPENYTFSEPQVVMTAPAGNPYGIVEWLSNNQQVLITEGLINATDSGSNKFPQQSISLYNPETSESMVYAIRPYTEETPLWQPELNAIVYPVINSMGIDKNTYHPIYTRQLWVSYGDPNTVQMLADNMSQFPIAIKPEGSEMFYLADKKIAKLDKSLKKLSSALFDPAQYDYGKGYRNKEPIFYEMAWQPNTPLIFLYSNGSGLEMGGYTFIMNADTGKVCELDFGGWARKALWSSDGHYLAIIRGTEYTSPVSVLDMAILDTITGELFTNGVIPQVVSGKRYVYDFKWAPDNRHLLAVGSTSSQNDQNDNGVDELYLLDFMSSKVVSILPEYSKFFSSGLAWSPDGSRLIIRCPISTKGDRICLIPVQEAGK
jgi:WD40 repeat protein